MPSPFPGMNPYLEQEGLWPDFHERFCPLVAELLTGQVRPHYIVKINEQLYIHELPAESGHFMGRADVAVTHPPVDRGARPAVEVLEAPAQIRLPAVDVERLSFVEIRDRESGQLVTVIELVFHPTELGHEGDRCPLRPLRHHHDLGGWNGQQIYFDDLTYTCNQEPDGVRPEIRTLAGHSGSVMSVPDLGGEMKPITRRRILEGGTLGAAALAFGVQTKGAVEQRVTVGLIGAGGMGGNHLRLLAARRDVDVAFVCDVDRNRLAEGMATVEKGSGKAPKGVSDLRRILDDRTVDAVWIATPDHWHAPAAILAC